MSKVLFNINDLALILVISSSLIFICVLMVSSGKKSHNYWLAGFLTCIALGCLKVILYWSPIIRLDISIYQPHIYLALHIAVITAAPALYVYTKSLVYKDFVFNKKSLLYFSATFVYLAIIPLIYLTMSDEQLHASALNYQVLYSNVLFWFSAWLEKIIQISFGLATVYLLHSHKTKLRNTSSNTEDIDGNWLKMTVIGFLCFWLVQAVSQLGHQFNFADFSQYLGLFGNYFLFGLVNLLVILSLTRSTETSTQDEPTPTPLAREFTEEQVSRLARTMTERQPFLKPDLTLDELSKITSIPQRTLSAIINRHHEKNFFEYINEHRVERAATLLLDSDKKLSMLDIMNEAGFNSKSAFNRFFKKVKGTTPSKYRAETIASS